MRINGEWLECDDGVVRPSVKGMVRLADGQWVEVIFLLDAGADRTVFSARFLDLLKPLALSEAEQGRLAGVGGEVDSITIKSTVGFNTDDGHPISVSGTFHLFTESENSDLSVLRPRRDQQLWHHLRLSESNHSATFATALLRDPKSILNCQGPFDDGICLAAYPCRCLRFRPNPDETFIPLPPLTVVP